MNGRCNWCGLWLDPTRLNDRYQFCNRRCGKASAEHRASLHPSPVCPQGDRVRLAS